MKLGDFGFSAFIATDQTLSTFCGSPPYAAPELFQDHSYLGPNVDIWALGVLLFFINTATLPFRGETIAKLKKLIFECNYVMPDYLSDDCQFLVRGILRLTPQDRFTLAEIRQSSWLNNEYFPPAHSPYPMNPSITPDPDRSPEQSSFRFSANNLENFPNENHNHCKKNGLVNHAVAIEARQKLINEYGIQPDQIRRSQRDGPRNNVTGMFRIVVHQVHRRNDEMTENSTVTTGDQPYSAAWNCQAGPLDEQHICTVKKKSKLCVLL